MISNELGRALVEFNSAKDRITKLVQEDLLKVARDVILETKTIRSIYWTQYTPGFNDGDPCEFSVDHQSFTIVGDEGNEERRDAYYNLASVEKWNEKEYNDRVGVEVDREDYVKVVTFFGILRSIDDSILETAFGNGVAIEIFRDKHEIEEFDCGY